MTLEQGLAEFLTHLGLEKNASDKTVKSYREDLTQALAFARDRLKKKHVDPADWTTRLLRAFVAWLHDRKYAKSTIARQASLSGGSAVATACTARSASAGASPPSASHTTPATSRRPRGTCTSIPGESVCSLM